MDFIVKTKVASLFLAFKYLRHSWLFHKLIISLFFYCCSSDDFEEFCHLASKLADDSQGAPLFTVAQSHNLPKQVNHGNVLKDDSEVQDDNYCGVMPVNDAEGGAQEDEWQLI